MRSLSLRSGVLWAFALAVLCGAGMALAAGSLARAEPADKHQPSLLGSYLVGRVARSQNDTEAAVEYFRRALIREPNNPLVLENAFFMEAAEGRIDEAAALARRIIQIDSKHRVSRLWLAMVALNARKLDEADDHLKKSGGGGPIGELTTALARAWVKLAKGESGAALSILDNKRLSTAAQTYIRYHRALIADLSGRRQLADREFEAVFERDPRTPRVALAYARHAASGGDFRRARSVLKRHMDRITGEPQPMVEDLNRRLTGDEVIHLLVESPEQGFSEVFYGLGEALASEGGVSMGAIYLQMGLNLRPKSPFALAALANVYELTHRYQRAIDTYDRIPAGTPLQKAVDIRKAINLNLLERVDDAKVLLESLANAHKTDRQPLITLGEIMRSRKRYAEAIEYYDRVIALTPKPEAEDWVHWYARGTSYERLKKWPMAEADLLKALQLEPNQPLALNYLGYSWIDQNRNLKQGMAMIEKAVAAKPDDGYIVDSLGWAHYRLGDFDQAVRYLERAVELRPEDPTLNDHLGDAYWRVGREREARFQWDQALTLKPEEEEVEKIKTKLDHGLPPVPIAKSQTKQKQTARSRTPRKRVESKVAPFAPYQ
ncbi:MAG: tetratricopeptide repeat protein [Hyphomicrobiaceae bacterium]